MGVTNDRGNPYDFQNVQGEIEHIGNLMETNANNAAKSPEKNRRTKKAKLMNMMLDRSIRATKRGARHSRRTENTNYLLNQSEQDEPEFCEMDFVDLMEHGLTPFAELFVQQEKMQIWNDFINQSEDDQMEMLHRWDGAADMESQSSPTCERQDSDDSWVKVEDSRNLHPAFSAEECFQQIDHSLRNLLSRRNMPLGILIDLEEDVIPFFLEMPTAVYICQLENSYKRMLLHALCQFLNLHSSSFNDPNGNRKTQVENLYDDFSPPSMNLSDYIEFQDGKR